ncbi:MAG: TetR/AcrR family transcriptional regulator [Endozoicomonas sp.]
MATNKNLNRQSYIDAAFAIISNEGVEKLSMRRVASELGVSAMAMYKHFANKDELLSAALDEFAWSSNVFPPDDLPWQEWVAHFGRGMFDALCGEVSWVPLLGSIKIGPKAMTITASFIKKLTDSGFSERDAMEAFLTIIQVVIGAASIQASMDFHQKDSPLLASFGQRTDKMSSESKALIQHRQVDIGLPMVIESLARRWLDSHC